jgi:hypothetical protein
LLPKGGFLSEIGGVCRVNGNLNLSRAIGDLKYKTNRTLEAKDQIITAQPDVRKVALQPEVRRPPKQGWGVVGACSAATAVQHAGVGPSEGPTQAAHLGRSRLLAWALQAAAMKRCFGQRPTSIPAPTQNPHPSASSPPPPRAGRVLPAGLRRRVGRDD